MGTLTTTEQATVKVKPRPAWKRLFVRGAGSSSGTKTTRPCTAPSTGPSLPLPLAQAGDIEYQTRPKFQRKTSDRHETCREMMAAAGHAHEDDEKASTTTTTSQQVTDRCKGVPSQGGLFRKPSGTSSGLLAPIQKQDTRNASTILSGPLAKAKCPKPRLPRGSLTIDKLCELDRALTEIARQRIKLYKSSSAHEDAAQVAQEESASLRIIRSRLAPCDDGSNAQANRESVEHEHLDCDDEGDDDDDDDDGHLLASMPVLGRKPRAASNPFESSASEESSQQHGAHGRGRSGSSGGDSQSGSSARASTSIAEAGRPLAIVGVPHQEAEAATAAAIHIMLANEEDDQRNTSASVNAAPTKAPTSILDDAKPISLFRRRPIAPVFRRSVSQPVVPSANTIATKSFSDTPFEGRRNRRPPTSTMSPSSRPSSAVKRASLVALNSLGGYAPSREMRGLAKS